MEEATVTLLKSQQKFQQLKISKIRAALEKFRNLKTKEIHEQNIQRQYLPTKKSRIIF